MLGRDRRAPGLPASRECGRLADDPGGRRLLALDGRRRRDVRVRRRRHPDGDRLAQYAGWATVLLQLAGLFLVGIGFIFPTGRPQSRGWARFLVLFTIFAVGFVTLSLTQPGPLQLVPDIQNPFGFGPDLRGDRPLAPILLPFVAIVIGGLVSRWSPAIEPRRCRAPAAEVVRHGPRRVVDRAGLRDRDGVDPLRRAGGPIGL